MAEGRNYGYTSLPLCDYDGGMPRGHLGEVRVVVCDRTSKIVNHTLWYLLRVMVARIS